MFLAWKYNKVDFESFCQGEYFDFSFLILIFRCTKKNSFVWLTASSNMSEWFVTWVIFLSLWGCVCDENLTAA